MKPIVNNQSKDLLRDYTDEYSIEIWETEEDCDRGEGFIYDKVFESFDKALAKARRLYDYNNYACVEIIDGSNNALFCKDDSLEEFYLKNDKFCLVSKEIVDEYIDNWMDHKELPTKENKIYCKMVLSGYLAIDNSSNECYVEEFDTEKQAQEWLLGKDKDEIIEEDDEEVTL